MNPIFDGIFSDKVAVDVTSPEKNFSPTRIMSADFADVAPLRKNISPDLKDEDRLIAAAVRQSAVIYSALRGVALGVARQENPRVGYARQVTTPEFFAVAPLRVVGSRRHDFKERFQIVFAEPMTKNFAGLIGNVIPFKARESEARVAEPMIKNFHASFFVSAGAVDGLNQRVGDGRENILVSVVVCVQLCQNFHLRGQRCIAAEKIFQRNLNEIRHLEKIRQA